MKIQIDAAKFENSLTAMVEDCDSQLRPIGKFRFKHMEGLIFAFEVWGSRRWLDGGYQITVVPWAAGQCFRYMVEREVVLKGDRDTPDDYDTELVKSYTTLHEAFTRIIVEWFQAGIETALQNADGARLDALDSNYDQGVKDFEDKCGIND